MTEEKFDYSKAVARLEEIAKKVEDPASPLDDIDRYISESEKLASQCRDYLRTAREKLSTLE